jgi:hypothetical protein
VSASRMKLCERKSTNELDHVLDVASDRTNGINATSYEEQPCCILNIRKAQLEHLVLSSRSTSKRCPNDVRVVTRSFLVDTSEAGTLEESQPQ